MEVLATIWFVLIVVLWIGYLFLDGFDLGVGMLLPFLARRERGKRVCSIRSARSGTATRSG
jgi:cytochrome d ubiquinol oxidase subunit II